MNKITKNKINQFKQYLLNMEKSKKTQEKYLRDIYKFSKWLANKEFEKKDVIKYKQELLSNYALSSVNSIISSLNSFFNFCGWYDLKIKFVKVQKQIYIDEDKELTKEDYLHLINTAKILKKEQLQLILLSIASTGIRVSELKHITVESIEKGRADILNKGKYRSIFLPNKLCIVLKKYAKKQKIKSGPIFITKTGKPLDRSNIWTSMKKLCEYAGIKKTKVYPHNLRHLFAKTYYSQQKDVVRLADILGHSSINTTRIYTVENGEIHRQQIQELGLI